MEMRRLGRTGLSIAPLVFGGNVFGWTADEKTSFSLLDAFFDAGFNAVDTADVYSSWAPGNRGGESEAIIGKWLKQSGRSRDSAVIVTKVGSELGPDRKGLSRRWIMQAVEDSLRRLQTDYIDLYLSHWPDPDIPYDETLAAYDTLLSQGKLRAIGASNLDAQQMRDALDVAAAKDLPRYDVLQPEYNLYDRASYDGPLRNLCIAEEIGVITYFSLARGFLSGKYRSHKDLEGSARGGGVEKYLDGRGMRILGVLDEIAEETGAKQAEIALAWIIAREGVTAPIASATNPDQLASLVRSAELDLPEEAIRRLNEVSE
ncbi:aldo/keto reductase [Sinorhizobium meliloti]|uniref:Oxidoreductase, aldo/keto reductase family n=2 Tax=Rhizobium meliloti TaxID=382 RepID=F7X4M0_SINMM|nr:aldo/keto reductase [Sinorhizobium meliloti]PST29320.1 aldo/keto reductase [Mesorhizobium loti]TWB00063.1 aryl-alcohol dehydrogenase-like predicted oxidoreductase [Ensifer sp. SEMIA 134]TWB34501.1 aryl-alcohol dehydrogenase-like predicted oxidoreductase [Ensifer sp. SEMIA 135]AEG55327.1 NADP-dependent oxidoreductase domain protein [Sinorhizobium meliloti AK83]AEH80996.1 oxidoreductase, aldo/keto reductase family [Sinorhizobium meliloti SM11]